MDISTPDKLDAFIAEREESYRPLQRTLLTRIAIDRCMYEGCHWITNSVNSFNATATTGRRLTNWNPDSNKLVATVNRIIPLIRECSTATSPTKIEVDVEPPDRDAGIEQAEKSRVLESMLTAMVDECRYLNAASDANFRRCIDGSHGIGLRIKVGKRPMAGDKGDYDEDDQVLSAFSFDVTKLTLDPFNQSRDLRLHDEVLYSDVWTLDAIRNTYGVELDENDCQTVGELCQLQLQLNKLSENRLYANLPRYSKTKGAVVHQLHIKDSSGCFETMLIGIKAARQKKGAGIEWINFDNPQTPFGGKTKLPFTLLHGAMRPDSMWSLSDAFLLKDDQDRINLLNTFAFRILQKSAGYQWLIERGAVVGKDIDNYKQQFNNAVAGVIEWDAGTRDKLRPAPQLIQTPQPPPFIQEMVQVFEQAQRRMVHREDITSGAYKTHTTNETYQTANENAQQVLGDRIVEDKRAHNALLETLLGTSVKLALSGTPSVLATMRRAGFDETDFSMVSQTDPDYPACSVSIRDSSIRNESKDKKEQRIWQAAQLPTPVLSPTKLRIALADLGTPIDGADKAMLDAARKAAVRVMLGEQWVPISLGDSTDVFVSEFRQAAVSDRRAQMDPSARQRLSLAIESMLAMANIEMQQQAMAQNPPAPAQAGQPGGDQQEMPQEVNVADLITSLSGGAGGGSESAQPSAA